MTRMSVSEARAMLSEVISRVEAGEEVTLTRHDREVAVIVAPHHLSVRRVAATQALDRATEIGRRLDAARTGSPRTGALTVEQADELVRQIRVDRDAD